jgi:hypothetical protein
MVLPFGKFKGHDLAAVPNDYILFLLSIPLRSPALRQAVKASARDRGLVEEPEPSAPRAWSRETAEAALELVALGYRQAARRHHPDHGGDVRAMQAVNAAREVLTALVGEAT